MRIHWARIALVAVAVLGARVAEAQLANETTVVRTPSSRVFTVPQDHSYLPLYQQVALQQAEQAQPPLPLARSVVMYGGMGGSIAEHVMRFTGLAHTSVKVEMRGGCWSACTLITSYVPKERLCFAPGSFLAFHAAVANLTVPLRSEQATRAMFDSYPPEIKHWINDHGGVANLRVESYWTMYDRELWAIGYAKCQ